MNALIRTISTAIPAILIAASAFAEKPTSDNWWKTVSRYDGTWTVTLNDAEAPALLTTHEWMVPFEKMRWHFSEAPGQPMTFDTGACWWNAETERIELAGMRTYADGDIAYKGYIDDVDPDAETVTVKWSFSNIDGSKRSEVTMVDTFGDNVIERAYDVTSGTPRSIKTAKFESVNAFQKAMPQASQMVGRWTRSITNDDGKNVTVMFDVAWGPGRHTLDGTIHRKIGDAEPVLRGKRTWMLDRRSGDVWCMNNFGNGMRMTARPKFSKTEQTTVIRGDWTGRNANGNNVAFSTEETLTGDEWTNQWMNFTFEGVTPPNATGEPSEMTTLNRVTD